MSKIRVLVVDDSATMRRLVSSALMSDPDIEVVSLAPDAATARQAIKDLSPDVMTLDIEMPNMNGLDFSGESHAPAAHASGHGIHLDGSWK